MMQFYRSPNPTRSRSVEASHRDSAHIIAQQHEEPSSSSAIPSYMRELAASRINRHSRASSIVSTATKMSTTTFGEDARSIDLVVGGQYFRIARDGSRICTDDDAPPPYGLSPDPSGFSALSPPLREHSPSISEISDNSIASSRILRNARYFITSEGESEDEAAEEGTLTPRQRSPVRLRANILDPGQLDLPSPVDTDDPRPNTALAVDDDGETPVRNLSYKQGPEVLTLAPESRKLRRIESQTGLNAQASRMASPLRRRNGVRLASLDTQMLPIGGRATFQGSKQVESKNKSLSAGPILCRPHEEDEPRSPDFIGRRAHGTFPRPSPMRRSFTTVQGVDNIVSDEHQNSPQPLPMDNENDISLHYAGIMRRLDQDHRKEFLFKEREVAHLRQRLVEMDTVYRQELRSRDFIIDDLRARLQHLEEQTEIRIEKARNSIEDIWETRWKAQSFHLWERMRRIEEESQKAVDRILSQRKQDEAGDEEHERA